MSFTWFGPKWAAFENLRQFFSDKIVGTQCTNHFVRSNLLGPFFSRLAYLLSIVNFPAVVVTLLGVISSAPTPISSLSTAFSIKTFWPLRLFPGGLWKDEGLFCWSQYPRNTKIRKKVQFQKYKNTLFSFSKMAKNQFLHQKKFRKLHVW